MNPSYPIYVISKGRWASRLTVKQLSKRDIPFRIVIESQEHQHYSKVINEKYILVLPFQNLGQGSIPARNWVWEHSIDEGYDKHWILDDNLMNFYRFNNNLIVPTGNDIGFKVLEDFADRYVNIALAGFQYSAFVPRKEKHLPFLMNTRVYSCILIKNDIPYRWRGRYNEDTDLSLRVLKDRWCTVLFNAFLVRKALTMKMKGGNTDELYQGDGRLKMAQSLQQQHPDVVKITQKWGRWQHQVDYRPFKKNKLIRKRGVIIPGEPNEYGMKLVKLSK